MDWTPVRTALTWLGIALCLAVSVLAGLVAYLETREGAFGVSIVSNPPAPALDGALMVIVRHPWPVLALAVVGAVLLWRLRPE